MSKRRDIDNKNKQVTPPRELTPIEKTLLSESKRIVSVQMNGEVEELSTLDVVIRKALQVAAKGSPHAIGHIMRGVNDAQKLEQQQIEVAVEEGRSVKKRLEDRLETAVQQGFDPNWVIPHPDDIMIDPTKGWSVIGPVDQEQLKSIRETVAIRDALILQAVLEERLVDRHDLQGPELPFADQPGSTSLVFAHILDESLPVRFRQSDFDLIMTMDRLERLTKRELLKASHQRWAKVGKTRPRGWTIQPWCQVGQHFTKVMGVLVDLLDELKGKPHPAEMALANELRRRLE